METKSVETAPTGLAAIIEALQQHARTCETAAQDSTQESLTGESHEKDRNIQDAKDWLLKAQVWIEAEAVVRGFDPGAGAQLPPPLVLSSGLNVTKQ